MPLACVEPGGASQVEPVASHTSAPGTGLLQTHSQTAVFCQYWDRNAAVLGRPLVGTYACTAASVGAAAPAELPGRKEQERKSRDIYTQGKTRYLRFLLHYRKQK